MGTTQSHFETQFQICIAMDIYLKSEFDVLQTGFDSSQFDTTYATVLSRNNNDLILLREELSHLQIQEQLVKFSENLQPGLPCDLCGSTHHPNPLLNDFSRQKIEGKKDQINKLDIAISQLNSLNIQIKTAFSNKDNHKHQLDTILENLKNSEIAKQQLQDTSPNVDFTFQEEQKFKDFYVAAKNKIELLKSKRIELELNSIEMNIIDDRYDLPNIDSIDKITISMEYDV